MQFTLESSNLNEYVKELPEIDYPVIYSKPNEETMKALENNTNCLDMYLNGLPEKIM